MDKRFHPPALLWVLFLALAGRAVVLRLRYPGQHTPAWILIGLLSLVALRLFALALDWRRGRLPATRLLLPALVGLEGLGLMLAQNQGLVFKLRLATALGLEVCLLVLAVRAWRSLRAQPGVWPEDRIALALEAFIPPRAARLIALELVMMASALRFLAGGFRAPAPPGFSHHREAALGGFLPALPLLIPGDILLLHALFPHLAPWLRWILHGSTIYAVFWFFGFYATLKARPHQIREGHLHLHQGLLKSATVPIASIQSIQPLPDFDDDWARHAHLKGVQKLVADGPAVLELELSEPVRVLGLLGPGRPATRLAFSVDDPSTFRAALDQAQRQAQNQASAQAGAPA